MGMLLVFLTWKETSAGSLRRRVFLEAIFGGGTRDKGAVVFHGSVSLCGTAEALLGLLYHYSAVWL